LQLKGGLMKTPNHLPKLNTYRFLVSPQYRELLFLYLEWIRLLALRGFHQKNKTEKTFNRLYKAVSRTWKNKFLLGRLQTMFIKENLSLSLLLEPIDGFEWLSKNRYPLTFSASSPIILQIVAPIARLIAVLNNEHPPFYQPFSSLVCTYLSLYLVYTDELINLLKKVDVSVNQEEIIKDLPLKFLESKQVLPTIQGIKFKLKMSFYLRLCHILIKKKANHKINFWDYVNVFLGGLWYTLTVKGKNIKTRKI